MPKLKWDAQGSRLYETGVSRGVLYLNEPKQEKPYSNGVVWNGLTNVNQSPSGAEPQPIYADNIKYLNLMSEEEFSGTIEAYTYPDEFARCDGLYAVPAAGNLSASLSGITIGQQNRETFGFSYRTILGNDEKYNNYGYKIHLIYNCLAAPSQKSYQTVNNSPEAITFSWSISTTGVEVTDGNTDLKPTSVITLNSTLLPKKFMNEIEKILYGDDTTNARLPMPDEVLSVYRKNAA